MEACASFEAFSQELRKVFGPVTEGPDVTGGLLNIQQGDRSVSEYAIDFRTSSWNMAAQCDIYLAGLSPKIKFQLVSFDLPSDLDGLRRLKTRLDHRLSAWRNEGSPSPSPWVPTCTGSCDAAQPGRSGRTIPCGGEEPVQVGRSRLTPAEQERRRRENLCLYCGQAGNFLLGCPLKGRAQR